MRSFLHVCPDWPVVSIYTLRCVLSTIHAYGSIQFIHVSAFKGNLKITLVVWRSIGAPDFILSIIENGYGLPFCEGRVYVFLRFKKWLPSYRHCTRAPNFSGVFMAGA